MKKKAPGILSKVRRRQREPLEVRLSMRVKFGDAPDEAITLMEDRRVPMVDSVFASRDRIMRGFLMLMARAGAAQPKVARELLPILKLLPWPSRAAGRKK